jgi:hypothetical protein
MTSEVVAEIEEQVRQLRATGKVAPGLEDQLDECFEQVAEQCLAAGDEPANLDPRKGGGVAAGGRLGQLHRRSTAVARRRFGPAFRRLERRAALRTARAGEAAATQVHVAADRLERIAARSPLASRALSTARPCVPQASSASPIQPRVEGPLFDWVLDKLSREVDRDRATDATRMVVHAECSDGRVVEALVARGIDARGADPHRPARANGNTNIVAAGALEYLGATPSDTLDGILLTGVVDRLRPGAARALAELVASRLAPGGVVVLVSARPEAAAAVDPVASDLAPGRPVNPVTWCHLFARYGLSGLSVFDAEGSEPDVFAVCAGRPDAGSFGGAALP